MKDVESVVCKKVSFADEKQALFYIDKLGKTSSRTTVPQRAYLCQKCLNWHLTSKQENKTYFSLLTENETLKKELAEKERIISELTDKTKSNQVLNLEKLVKEKNDKLVEQNSKINKLESKLKKKDKTLNSIAKLILDSMNLK